MTGSLLTRLGLEARRMKRRLVPSAIILMYHRVADVSADPWRLAVTPANFDQQIQLLRSNGVRLLSMTELVTALIRNQVPRCSAAITFDDGYLDNLTTARPILERHDAPATVFVPAGLVGSSTAFWWDRLEGILLCARTLPSHLQLGSWSWDVPADREGRERLYRQIWQSLTEVPAEEREGLVSEVRDWAGLHEDEISSARIMNEEELRRIGDGGLVEIGSHGWSHSKLGELEPEAQRSELQRSRDRLQDIVGASIAGMSFPHGSRSAESATLAKDCGYFYACGSVPRSVRRGIGQYDLPRIVVDDCDGDEFGRLLADNLLT